MTQPTASPTWSLLQAIELTADGAEGFTARTHPEFWTFIGPFGGWSAAVALKAVMRAIAQLEATSDERSSANDWVPVSINVHFAGAMDAGAVAVVPTLTRRNRGTAFWRCQILQKGACAIDAHIVMARRRDTRTLVEHMPPDAPDPLTLSTTEYPGIPWTTTYDCRFVTSPPGEDSGTFRSVFWVRLRHDEDMRLESLVALCDACFPRPYFRTQTLFPSSTLSLNVQLHAEQNDLDTLRHTFLLVEANGNQAHRGFFDQHLRVWSPDGKLLATSEQLFWYKMD